MFNILLTSSGRRGSLVQLLKQSMGTAGFPEGLVLTADMQSLSAAALLADGHHVVPPCSTHAYVDVLIELCGSERVRLLMPTIDTELGVWPQPGGKIRCPGDLRDGV